MTGKQLKNSILQWAIQGKLVPQDPNDEPASVLLEKIRAEKARLIKEGKIKKDKKESIIYRGDDNSHYEKFADGKVVCIDDEIPFEIPTGWEWCRFSSIYWQLTDGTHSTPKYTQSGIPFLSVKDMSNGKLSFANTKYISEEEHKLLSQRCHPCKGDLLLSKVGTTGIPLIIDDDRDFSIFVSLALIKFFPKFVDSSFLVALLNSPLVQMQVKENTRGVGNKNWVLTAISNTLLAIPPLREQQHIVDRIAILSPYTERYTQSESKISHLNKEIGSKLKKSILQEAIQGRLVPQDPNDDPASILLQRIKEEKQRLVKEGKLKKKDVVDSTIYRGDDNRYYEQVGKRCTDITAEIPFDIPEAWCWARGETLFLPMQSTKPTGTTFIYIDVDAVNNKKNIIDKAKTVETIKSPSRATRKLHENDILFSMVRPYLKNIALVEKQFSNAIASTGFYVITPTCGLLPKYLFYLMLSPYVVDGLNVYMKGDNSPSINNIHIENFLYPLPPLNEQQRIVEKIEELYVQL